MPDIDADILNKAQDELNTAGAEGVWISQCDVSNEQQVEATVNSYQTIWQPRCDSEQCRANDF